MKPHNLYIVNVWKCYVSSVRDHNFTFQLAWIFSLFKFWSSSRWPCFRKVKMTMLLLNWKVYQFSQGRWKIPYCYCNLKTIQIFIASVIIRPLKNMLHFELNSTYYEDFQKLPKHYFHCTINFQALPLPLFISIQQKSDHKSQHTDDDFKVLLVEKN